MKRLSSPRAARPGQPAAVLQETDELIAECEAFIGQAKSSLAVLPFQAINEWRTRRKDEQLMITYENIQPRIQQSEKALRDLLEQSAEKKQSLREQAKELQSKLGDCIDFNRGELEKSDPVLNQLRSVVDVVSNQSSSVKFMLQFNDEVARQKLSEESLKEKSLAPWSVRMSFTSAMNNVESFDVSKDDDHLTLSNKLSSLRTMREHAMSALAVLLEQKEMCTQNLSGCTSIKDTIDGILHRERTKTWVANGNNASPLSSRGDAGGDDMGKSFEELSGSSVVISAEACAQQYDEAQKLSAESTLRLERLVDLRERLSEIDASLSAASDT